MNLLKCDKCGYEFPESRLDLHHIIPKYLGGTDGNCKRIYLCKKCHNEIHKLIVEVTKRWLNGKQI